MQPLELTIIPGVGIGNARFGMDEAEIRAAFCNAIPWSRTTRLSSVRKDDFIALGIRAWYSKLGKCDAIEAFGSARPTLFGRLLVGQPYSELNDWLADMDPRTRVDNLGCRSPKLGVGFYAPKAVEQPHAPIEGVIVFADGYYEK